MQKHYFDHRTIRCEECAHFIPTGPRGTTEDDWKEAVMAMTDHILVTASKGDQRALDVLFSVTVHFLASETSGRLEEKYIENLRKCIPPYRNGYAEMVKEMKKAMKNLS